MTRIFHWLFMWKMDPMSGLDIRRVFTLPPSDSTLQYKRCVHSWNNFSCIKSLSCADSRVWKIMISPFNCEIFRSLSWNGVIHTKLKRFQINLIFHIQGNSWTFLSFYSAGRDFISLGGGGEGLYLLWNFNLLGGNLFLLEDYFSSTRGKFDCVRLIFFPLLEIFIPLGWFFLPWGRSLFFIPLLGNFYCVRLIFITLWGILVAYGWFLFHFGEFSSPQVGAGRIISSWDFFVPAWGIF